MSNDARLQAQRAIGVAINLVNQNYGGREPLAILEALCTLTAGFASKAGGQSVECPIALIEEEATFIRDHLESVFGKCE